MVDMVLDFKLGQTNQVADAISKTELWWRRVIGKFGLQDLPKISITPSNNYPTINARVKYVKIYIKHLRLSTRDTSLCKDEASVSNSSSRMLLADTNKETKRKEICMSRACSNAKCQNPQKHTSCKNNETNVTTEHKKWDNVWPNHTYFLRLSRGCNLPSANGPNWLICQNNVLPAWYFIWNRRRVNQLVK